MHTTAIMELPCRGVCNDWGAWEPETENRGPMGADDRWTTLAGMLGSYSALNSSWVMRDHTTWFYELHDDGQGANHPFTPWYPYCPAHDGRLPSTRVNPGGRASEATE